MAKKTLAALSVQDLRRELARRQRGVSTLIRRRARLMSKVTALDVQIKDLGGAVSGAAGGSSRGSRPRNEMNLVEALAKLLDGKTMNVTTIAEEVQKSGYKTNSANFRTIVNQTLINSGKFKRVGRGEYTAK